MFRNISEKSLLFIMAALMIITSIPVAGITELGPEAPELEITTYDTASPVVDETVYMLSRRLYPESYSSVDRGFITSPQNQGQFGTCWTFAAASMAESSLISQGLTFSDSKKATVDAIDLSEAQTAYFTFRETYDPLGNLGGDKTVFLGDDWLNSGGNHMYTSLAFASWQGLCEDSLMPYDELSADVKYDAALSYAAAARMTNSFWLQMSDTEHIKELIMEYGSVLSDFAFHEEFMNADTGAYHCDKKLQINHSATIVGWDDEYSKNNFKDKPEGDGAWLVKNSWGEDWGNNGYFWISYYDKSLKDNDATCMLFNDVNMYDNNYQYDGTCALASLNLFNNMLVANTYTVSAYDKEKLEAVSFALLSANVHYKIEIFKNCISSTLMNGEALLSEPITGQTTFEGYYTVEIPEDIVLSRGDEYTICIEFESATNSYVNVMIDYASVDQSGMFLFDSHTEHDKSYYGQNTILSTTGKYFYDLIDTNSCTARIKGFTSNLSTVTADIENVDHSSVPQYANVGNSLEFSVKMQDGASFPQAVMITDNGIEINDFVYDNQSGYVYIPKVNGDIVISVDESAPETKPEHKVIINGMEQSVAVGEPVTATAPFYVDSYNYGHRFKYWICSETGLIVDITDPDLAFIMPDRDIELVAKYNIVGDIDDDGIVAGVDILQLNSIIRGQCEDPYYFGDIDNDGIIAGTDLLYIAKIIQGSYIPKE